MDLSVRIPTANGPFVLKNPLMPAAATLGNNIEYRDWIDLNRLGALIPNSLAITTGAPSLKQKFITTEYGLFGSFGRNNMSAEEYGRDVLPHLPWKTTPVIINTKAGDMDEMAELAAILGAMEGVAAIEVNLNCPYAGTSPTGPYWKTPPKLVEMLRKVRAAAPKKVIIAKVPTGTSPVDEITKYCAEGGADIVVSFNGTNGAAVDIYSRRFKSGGGGGPGFKPFGLSACRRCAKAADIPIIGAGGIACAEDVLEYIMAGAWAVQVGSVNFTRPDFMVRLLEDLEALMEKLGIESLEEIRGCAAD